MKYLLFVLFLSIPIVGFSQEQKFDKAPVAKNLNEIRTSIVYPDSAFKNNIQSNVLVDVLVDTLGDVTRVKWAEGDLAFFDTVTQAASLIKFEPGIYNDRPTKVWMRIPFSFKLGIKKKNSENK